LLKDCNCGALSRERVGEKVTLAGWVHRRRDHGGMVFIDLRDRDGITQVVFNPRISREAYDVATSLRNEFVVQVTGEVVLRPAGTENLKLSTGEIEVTAVKAVVLNESLTPPFYINEDVEVEESLYLKNRYLYLRRPRMKDNLILRHRITKFMSDFLDAQGFIQVETPLLIKSTPEGARDYLVPSRVNQGKFYALPQSPQQLKQLLMVAGIEKYFQIARCFRDEDLRADRQPEFTQLDLEMSFVEEDDILGLMEKLLVALVREVKPEMEIATPIPRLSYEEAMKRYGTDKPDIRFGLEIRDISDIASEVQFGIFRSAVAEGGNVKGICLPGCAGFNHHRIAELTEVAKNSGAQGLVTVALTGENLSSSEVKSVIAKHLTSAEMERILSRCGARPGDLVLIVADQLPVVNRAMDELRRYVAPLLNLIDKNLLNFVFVIDFPLLKRNSEENSWECMHHPFTAPRERDISLLDTDPGKVGGRHFDVVCNGCELGSGSIRIHTHQLQEKIFSLLGYSREDMFERFGTLLEAMRYGAPPHGGIALGIDRLVMMIAGAETIREIIAFPKNQNAVDTMFDAPSYVSESQLDELNLRLKRAVFGDS
jgi:aspartyl-tRNA synthetase